MHAGGQEPRTGGEREHLSGVDEEYDAAARLLARSPISGSEH
jgi:hypothetical protein